MKRFSIVLLGLMLLLAAALSASAADDDENISRLIVQGEGKATAVPDMAIVVLGVETRNASAAGAVEENARLMNGTVDALLRAGIAEKNIQTSRYSLATQTEEPKSAGEISTPPMFIATNQVTVRLNNTDDVGPVLDAAVKAGSNSIQEVSFDLQNPQPEKDRALGLAIEDARHKAAVAAKAAGVTLAGCWRSQKAMATWPLRPRAMCSTLWPRPFRRAN